MPLQSTNMYAGGPIKAADVIQFFNLFTGSMTDQPVTFANTLTVGGSQSDASVPFRVSSQATGTARVMELRTLQADVHPVFGISRLGVLSFGAGGGTATDVTLSRSAANQLTLAGLAGTPALIINPGGLAVVGNSAVGSTGPTTDVGLRIDSSALATTTQIGLYSGVVGSSAATTEIDGVWSRPSTAAASFTSASVASFHAASPIKGAGSTITNAYGVLIDSVSVAGATASYGIQIANPTGASGNNIGLFVFGTPSGGTTNAAIFVSAGLTQLGGGLYVNSGNVGIGAVPASNMSLQIANTLPNSAGQYGIQVTPVGGGGAATEFYGVNVGVSTAAVAGLIGSVGSFHASNPTKGAGSTITTAYGLLVDGITTGNTNNYGVSIGLPSGGSGVNIGLLNVGTSHLQSAVAIGTGSGPDPSRGLSILYNISVSAGGAQYGIWVQPLAVAQAANDNLHGLGVYMPSANVNGKASVSIYGIYITSPSQASLNNYGIYITGPSGASSQNVGLVSLGGIAVAGTTPALAGTLGISNTTATTAVAGGQTLPANPQGFLVWSLSGVNVKIPYYA